MNAYPMRKQCGQAMSEFVVALAVLLPLFLGIVYIGKFADMKHQAVQASRFAAFERALDPSAAQETGAVLAEETRARFFADPARNQGKLGYDDNTTGMATAGTLNPLWTEVSGAPLLQSYSDPSKGVQVNIASNSMDFGAFTPINEGAALPFDHINTGGQIQANVEVPIANITHLPAPLNNWNLRIAATTVVAGDAWNGAGSQDVADHQTAKSDMGKNPLLQVVQDGLIPLAAFFSDTPQGPQFGCVRPDVVPAATAPGASYQANDKCY